jgi:hypothetical protein
MCFDFPYILYLKLSSFEEEFGEILLWHYFVPHTKYFFFSDFNQTYFNNLPMHNFTTKREVAFWSIVNALKRDLCGYERDKGYQANLLFFCTVKNTLQITKRWT